MNSHEYQVLATMPPGLCRDNLLALTCSQFLPCFGGLVPQPVCRGLCDDVNTACSALFVLAGLNLLDCWAANPLVPSQPLYPTGSVSVPGVGEVPCIDYRSLAPPSPPAPPAEFSLSGTCQPYFGGAPCYGLVEGSVFVPDGTTQQDMIANNSALLGAVELAPSSCKQPGKAFFCRSLFMGCLENFDGSGIPLPPCRHLCNSAKEDCQELFESAGADFPECEQELNGIPLFPEGPVGCAITPNVSRYLPSGTCEEFDGEPAECAPYVRGRQVFVPLGMNQSALAALLEGQLEGLQFASRACRVPTIKTICGSLFPPCLNYTTGNEVLVNGETQHLELAVYQPPCKSVCRASINKCADFFSSLPDADVDTNLLPDCESGDLVTGERYPEDEFYIVAANSSHSNVSFFQCDDSELGKLKDPNCPYPLVFDPHADKRENPCTLECPDPYWKGAGYPWVQDYFFWSAVVLGIPGFICSLLQVTTNLLNPEMREWPRTMLIYLGVCGGLISFSVALMVFWGYWETVCENDYTYADQHYFKCGFTGGLIMFATALDAAWYCLVALDMFIKVVLEYRSSSWLKWPYHVGALAFATTVVAIPLAQDKIQYFPGGGLAWCWAVDLDDTSYDVYVFWIPVMILCNLALVLIVCTLGKMIFVMKQAASSEGVTRQFIRNYWRIVFFVFYWTSVMWIAFSGRLAEQVNSDQYKDDFNDWISCEVATADDDEDYSTCQMSDYVPLPLVVLTNAFLNAAGITPFFLFAFRVESYYFYKDLIVAIMHGDLRAARKRIRTKGTTIHTSYAKSKSRVSSLTVG